MALTAAAYGTQTAVISTEHSLSQKTGVGIYVLLVNTSAMQAGDTIVLNILTKREFSDSAYKAYSTTYSDVQTEPNKYSIPVPIDTEITVTLTQTVGVGRSYPWKLLRA